MSLTTGTPLGLIVEQSEIYVEGAPWIYFQRYEANELFNPDVSGFYWGLSGTVAQPIYSLACYEDVALGADYTINAIRCDKVGDKASIQKLNHLEVTLSLSSLFPLTSLSPIIRGSTVTVVGSTELMGIGQVNNNVFYHVYLPKVYDEDAGDYVAFTIHKAQFADAWSIQMPSGNKWMLSGIKIWGYADDTKPSTQQFATVLRSDLSDIP